MFKEIKTVAMSEYDGELTLFRHECGMEVLHVKNNSEELCGNFIFSTASEDDTGVAHILEHTVLCGSERFPVKDPFSQILLTSPNTFLNAMTFPDKTMYPFASPLKKDFDIIFDIYADAVFAPLLRKESFQQEGVRFCTGNIDGVVFNEMRGAFSSEDDLVSRYSLKKLFEGTPAAFESGGDPRYIPDLTYEEYIQRYRKWYSPANCRMFLYGNLDPNEYLQKIESRYLTQERIEKFSHTRLSAPSSLYFKSNAKPEYDECSCPVKDCSTVLMNWLTTGSDDPFEILTLSILTDILLGNPGAPLYKAIIESGLGDDLSPCSGMSTDFPVLAFSVGFTGAKKNAEKDIEKFILDEIRKLATEGIDIDQQRACMKRQKFKLQEIPGDGYPYGILVSIRASRFWLRDKDPIDNIDNLGLFAKLEKEFEKGRFFENWMMKNLVNNSGRCLVTVKEDPDFEGELQKILDEKYNNLRKCCGEKQYEEDKRKFEEFINREDSTEDLEKIPRITRQDLPERIPHFALEHKKAEGVDVRYMHTFTRGIVYMNIAFDASCLDKEELELFSLFTRAIQMCGTSKHSYSEIGVLINKFTGRFSIVNTCGTKYNGQPGIYMILRSSALKEDLPDALNLIKEILLESYLKDTERLAATITDLITDWESEYVDSGHVYSSMYSVSRLSQVGLADDIVNGTRGYLSTLKLQNLDREGLENLAAKLNGIREKIVNKNTMVFEYCCEEKDNEYVLDEAGKSLSSYPQGQSSIVSSFYSEKPAEDFGHKYISLSNGPAYNTAAFKVPFEDERKLVITSLAASVFNTGYLFENIRGKGGAYGAGGHLNLAEKTYLCYSYRDPNIEKTIAWYEHSFDSEITKNDIDYTVAAIIGKELRPFVPKAKCYEALRRSLFGLTDELYLQRRKNILSITLEEVKEICAQLKQLFREKAVITTVCGKDMIKEKTEDVLNLPI